MPRIPTAKAEVHPYEIRMLNPSTSECGCIWRQGFQRGDEVKMGPFVWVLLQCVLIRTGELDTQEGHQGCASEKEDM